MDQNLTRNTPIMNRISNTSTVHLRATRTYTEFSLVKSFLIHKRSNSPAYSIIRYVKFSVILPNTGQNNSNFRVPMTCPKTKHRPANKLTINNNPHIHKPQSTNLPLSLFPTSLLHSLNHLSTNSTFLCNHHHREPAQRAGGFEVKQHPYEE